MRNAYMEKEEAKKLKQKQRDRMSAKTGKMDIAYEVRQGPLTDTENALVAAST
jgi:hypothetical protein